MLASEFVLKEEARGLNNVVNTDITPLQEGRIAFGCDANGLAVDNQVAVDHFDGAVEGAVHRVVLEHVGHVIGRQKVVDTDNFNTEFGTRNGGAENETADTTETVNTNFDGHFSTLQRVKSEMKYVLVVFSQAQRPL